VKSVASRIAAASLISMFCASVAAAASTEVTAPTAIVVSSSGPGAAEEGLNLLRRGGTAMDAAMAVAMIQPCYALGSFVSYGGVITIVYFDAKTHEIYTLDGGYNSVRGEKDPRTIPGPVGDPIVASGAGAAPLQARGRTVFVPGFFAGVDAAHKRFGKLPFADIVAPAIRCAEQGFALTPYQVRLIQSRWDVLSRLPETRAIFIKSDGTPYGVGETFKQPALAKTLRAVARDGAIPYMYKGDWAKHFVAAVQRDGGLVIMDDLAAYKPTWAKPAHTGFNGFEVYSLGAPILTGSAMLEAMKLVDRAGLVTMPSYDRNPATLFRLLQIAKVGTMLGGEAGTADLEKLLQIDLSPQARLEEKTADSIWSAMQAGKVPMVGAVPSVTQHTDAIVVVDGTGNVAAVVHSSNSETGLPPSIFVDGISLPESASFQQELIASLTPGSRIPAGTHPGIALKGGKVALAFGSTGNGSMTRSIAALLSVLGQGMTPQQAIDAPALGGFEFVPGPRAGIRAIVGQGEFSETFLKQLQELGQSVRALNAGRGYWLGVSIDPETGVRRAGAMREFPMLGGGALGY
jgi:gamma-glutamyltranspeptidase/glutathione hydrolase